MRTFFLALFLIPALSFLHSADYFADFDGEGDKAPVIPENFILDADHFYSPPQALRYETGVKGIMPVSIDLVPGHSLGVSFNYTTSEGFDAVTTSMQFIDAAGKILSSIQRTLGKCQGWERLEEYFPGIPGGASRFEMQFFPRKKQPGEYLVIDNLRIVSPGSYEEFFPGIFDLPLFDAWKRREANLEKFLPGIDGQLFQDWQRSRFGESCFMASGRGLPFTMPWKIHRIRVAENQLYRMEFFYVTSGKHIARSAVMSALFYDEEMQSINNPVSMTLKEVNDWTQETMELLVPSKAVWVTMRFCLINAAPDFKIYFNKLHFAPAQPTAKLQISVDSKKKILTGVIVAYSFGKEPLQTNVSILDSDGEKLADLPADADLKFQFPLRSLPDGELVLHAQVSDGIRHAEMKQAFHNFNQRYWENHRLGILQDDALPPPPWKPLSYPAERTVSTFLPEMQFTPTLALAQISQKQIKLLREPLQVLVNGQNIFALPAGKVQQKQSPNHSEFETELETGSYRVHIKTRTEFHNMTRYMISLTAKQDWVLEQLDVAFFPTFSDWLQVSAHGFFGKDIVSLKEEKEFSLKKLSPALWTGNDDHGLYAFFTRLYPAREEQATACHRFRHDKDYTTMIVHKPLPLRTGERYALEFAIGSTPVRPKTSKDGQHMRFRAGKYSTFDLMWSLPKYQPYCGFPIEPQDKTEFNAWFKNCPGKKFVYQIPFFIMEDLPQFMYFREDWRCMPERCYPPHTNFYPESMYNVDIADASWQDLYLYHLREYLTANPIDGLYFDGVGIYAHIDPNGDFSYRVFEVCDFMQRIYILQKSLKPGNMSYMHTGSVLVSPGTIFSELMLTGEQFRLFLEANRYYLQFLSLQEFRMQMRGNIGPVNLFLPQYRGEKTAAKDIASHTMGLVMLHDLSLYPSWIDAEVIDQCRNRLFAFYDRAAETRFVPYWKEGAFSSGNDHIVISAYVNASGEFQILLNTSEREQKCPVPAHKAKMLVYDPETDTTVFLHDLQEITLKPYMTRLIYTDQQDDRK